MKRFFLLALMPLMMLVGCNNSSQPKDSKEQKVTLEQVKKAEAELFNEGPAVNAEAVPNAIDTFKKFAEENPEDPQAPEYLFKALEVSVNTKQDPVNSILLCESLLEKYPEFDKDPVALFMVATFVYDEQMGDMDQAKYTYQRIIDNYPDSPFAKDAAISIGQLGMSPDELVKMFESNEK